MEAMVLVFATPSEVLANPDPVPFVVIHCSEDAVPVQFDPFQVFPSSQCAAKMSFPPDGPAYTVPSPQSAPIEGQVSTVYEPERALPAQVRTSETHAPGHPSA
ncbi:MAG: hypothetical protein J0H94_09250 [Rhizobiales bacterium]|nr:hypothetical protein [Hyphomicrobiales bacterium]